MYGKGNVAIKKYTKQYNHRLIGYELNNLNDYSVSLKKGKVEVIFIFTDHFDETGNTNYTIKINNGSEIMTSNTKELELDPDVEMADGGQMENSYEKGGELDEEDSLDYNSISDLQTERNRLVRWSNQYGSKGADYKIKQLEERIEYLKS